jgi:hypothetical protein
MGCGKWIGLDYSVVVCEADPVAELVVMDTFAISALWTMLCLRQMLLD